MNPRLIDVIVDALRRMNRDEGITLLIFEHNTRMIQEFCDYVYVLDAGRMICEEIPSRSGPMRGCSTASAAAVLPDERIRAAYLGGRAATEAHDG